MCACDFIFELFFVLQSVGVLHIFKSPFERKHLLGTRMDITKYVSFTKLVLISPGKFRAFGAVTKAAYRDIPANQRLDTFDFSLGEDFIQVTWDHGTRHFEGKLSPFFRQNGSTQDTPLQAEGSA